MLPGVVLAVGKVVIAVAPTVLNLCRKDTDERFVVLRFILIPISPVVVGSPKSSVTPPCCFARSLVAAFGVRRRLTHEEVLGNPICGEGVSVSSALVNVHFVAVTPNVIFPNAVRLILMLGDDTNWFRSTLNGNIFSALNFITFVLSPLLSWQFVTDAPRDVNTIVSLFVSFLPVISAPTAVPVAALSRLSALLGVKVRAEAARSCIALLFSVESAKVEVLSTVHLETRQMVGVVLAVVNELLHFRHVTPIIMGFENTPLGF
mmetsp:Transcript_8746/g.17707  ORF Transcript_8746/g.17707 Transcript_8746/m.17707 type:complete len:262 (+) Transcript_8746:1786-2571(+)